VRDTSGSRAARGIHVVVLTVNAAVLLGSVANSEIHALVFAFGNVTRESAPATFPARVDRLDVDELEQLHLIELPLGYLDNASSGTSPPGFEIELAQDHADSVTEALTRNLRWAANRPADPAPPRKSERPPGPLTRLFIRGHTGSTDGRCPEFVHGHSWRGDE
jgi:hypothetical protein